MVFTLRRKVLERRRRKAEADRQAERKARMADFSREMISRLDEHRENWELAHGGAKEQGEKVDISGDGKLKKNINKPGDGKVVPAGAKVFVKYVGSLEDGQIFDESGDRPFSFVLGENQVILGWELGVGSMQKGEISTFTIHPDFGYGLYGAGSRIGPGATLFFQIELVDWQQSRKDPKLTPVQIVTCLFILVLLLYVYNIKEEKPVFMLEEQPSSFSSPANGDF